MVRIFRDERCCFGSTGSGNRKRHCGLAGTEQVHEVSSLMMGTVAARESGAQRCAKISVTTMRLPQSGQRQGGSAGSADMAGLAVCAGASVSRGAMVSNS